MWQRGSPASSTSFSVIKMINDSGRFSYLSPGSVTFASIRLEWYLARLGPAPRSLRCISMFSTLPACQWQICRALRNAPVSPSNATDLPGVSGCIVFYQRYPLRCQFFPQLKICTAGFSEPVVIIKVFHDVLHPAKNNAERDIFSSDIIGVCQLDPVRKRKVPGMEGGTFGHS